MWKNVAAVVAFLVILALMLVGFALWVEARFSYYDNQRRTDWAAIRGTLSGISEDLGAVSAGIGGLADGLAGYGESLAGSDAEESRILEEHGSGLNQRLGKLEGYFGDN